MPETTDPQPEPVNPCTRGASFCGQHGYDCPPSAPADRAAEWRAAADQLEAHAATVADVSDNPAIFVAKARIHDAAVWREAAALLRRLAVEAPAPSRAGDETQPRCVCGEPFASGTVHRTDGPCYVDEAQPESGACTCAAAGDCFAPAGHYADCPQWQPAA